MSQDLYGKCPYVTAQKVIQGKWSILILHYLSEKPIRFNTLLKMMPEMTHATLCKQLKQLEYYGLIVRTEYPQVPPKVEYALSDIGKAFLPTLQSLHGFGEKYIDFLEQSGQKS